MLQSSISVPLNVQHVYHAKILQSEQDRTIDNKIFRDQRYYIHFTYLTVLILSVKK